MEQAAEVTGDFAFVVGVVRVAAHQGTEFALIEPQPVAVGAAVQFDRGVGPDVRVQLTGYFILQDRFFRLRYHRSAPACHTCKILRRQVRQAALVENINTKKL